MSPVFDRAIINQVHSATDIVDVVSEHVSLKKKGREMVGLCPFHEDHTPSLCVNPTKQIFKCFACGAGGSVFTFVQMRENLTFPQALERLAQRAGIKLRPATRQKSETGREQVDPNKLAEINAWAAKLFQKNLFNTQQGKAALDYLAQRKISPESTKKWQLGLALDGGNNLLQAAKKLTISEKLLHQSGLVAHNKQAGEIADKFVHRLMFPIADVTGRIIAFGGRALAPNVPKYINSPATPLFDKSNSVYGLNHARHGIVETGIVAVAEGYTDCIMAHQFGFANIVATLGTSFTPGHARILRRYAKEIVLVFDSDTAGVEAANRALEICLAQPVGIRIASIPKGKDPCEFLLTQGREEFQQVIESAVDVFEFKWKRLKQKLSGTDAVSDSKAAVDEFIRAVATGFWSGNLPTIEKGLIVNRLAKIIGLSARQVNGELKRRIPMAARSASYNAENQSVKKADLGPGYYVAAQQEILEVLLNAPGLYETARPQVTTDVFEAPVLRQIAQALFEAIAKQPENVLDAVLEQTESVEAGCLVAELSQAGEQKANYGARLKGALSAVRRYRTEQAKSQIKEISDQRQFLREYADNTQKENPHSIGML